MTQLVTQKATGKDILWTAEEAAQATGGNSNRGWAATGLSLNTRTIEEGDLFFALQGPVFDGHDFVVEAFERGASVAVVHHRPEGLPDDAALLMTDDTLAALNRMGAAARERSSARFIGITGSVGKTSVKEALAHCLSSQAPTACSPSSFNNHWGVPFSLCRTPRDAVYAINEMGMSARGEIRELTKLVRPDVAVITTIAPAHMEFFNSLEEIAAAKSEIFESMNPGGIAILNRDHFLFDHMAQAVKDAGVGKLFTFGHSKKADFQILAQETFASGSNLTVRLRGREASFYLNAAGEHWGMNAMVVLAAIDAVGADLDRAMQSLGNLPGVAGRGQRGTIQLPEGRGTVLLIDDSYNANPASVQSMLSVLAKQTPGGGGRLIAVLGDMLELGSESNQLHSDLAGPILDAGVKIVFACGPHMKVLSDRLAPDLDVVYRETSKKLAPLLFNALRDGDVIAIKGSLGSEMSVIVEGLKSIAK